jgi:hypothetical protein
MAGAGPVELGAETVVPTAVADEFRVAKLAYAEAKRHRLQAENRMRAAMGAAQYAVDPTGCPVASRVCYKHPGMVIPPHERDDIRLRTGPPR